MISREADAWIITMFFEPLASWFESQLGIGNYTAAKWFLLGGLLFIVISLGVLFGIPWWTLVEIKPRYGWSMLVFDSLYAMLFLVLSIAREKQFKKPTLGAAAPDNSQELNARGMFLFVSIVAAIFVPFLIPEMREKSIDIESFIFVWGEVGWILASIPISIGMYLLACSPRYPRDSSEKSRQLEFLLFP